MNVALKALISELEKAIFVFLLHAQERCFLLSPGDKQRILKLSNPDASDNDEIDMSQKRSFNQLSNTALKGYAKVATNFTWMFLKETCPQKFISVVRRICSTPDVVIPKIAGSMLWIKGKRRNRSPFLIQEFVRGFVFDPSNGTIRNLPTLSTEMAAVIKFLQLGIGCYVIDTPTIT